ncbi:MAG TPA: hypothetical protein VG433_14825, partial [Pirellulales bacterium]|nr:hypothetical protein [Pirellulales bacterium]
LVLAIAGLWLRRRDVEVWYVFTPIVAITLVHVSMFAGPRFTFTAEPSIVLLAACAALTKPKRMVSI